MDDKEQALNAFWSSFGVPAYDENTVPDDAAMPCITYETSIGDLFNTVLLSASVWTRSASWAWAANKAQEISDEIGTGGTCYGYDGGMLWIKRGKPFAQRVADPADSMIRRYLINIEADFLSA